ncbi:Frag1/DRAM/Sfk1 [Boletus coccyginus]|nr:Frag1/DRAM/Sfk1 [Boletus coccyginus]
MSLLSQRHRCFVLVPLFSAFIWFSSLLAMLLTWAISGCPKYVPNQVTVARISDVGASFLKPLFVVACCITGSGLVISLTIERLLRHEGRLPPELRRREHVFGRLAIVGAVIAMLGLACLSGFDVGRYPTTHTAILLVFIVGLSLSAIFTVIEFRWLALDFVEIPHLKRAYVAKAVVVLTLVVLGIVFEVARRWAPNVAGVVEWLIGFGLTFYLLTFAYDLRMASVTVGEVSKERIETP